MHRVRTITYILVLFTISAAVYFGSTYTNLYVYVSQCITIVLMIAFTRINVASARMRLIAKR